MDTEKGSDAKRSGVNMPEVYSEKQRREDRDKRQEDKKKKDEMNKAIDYLVEGMDDLIQSKEKDPDNSSFMAEKVQEFLQENEEKAVGLGLDLGKLRKKYDEYKKAVWENFEPVRIQAERLKKDFAEFKNSALFQNEEKLDEYIEKMQERLQTFERFERNFEAETSPYNTELQGYLNECRDQKEKLEADRIRENINHIKEEKISEQVREAMGSTAAGGHRVEEEQEEQQSVREKQPQRIEQPYLRRERIGEVTASQKVAEQLTAQIEDVYKDIESLELLKKTIAEGKELTAEQEKILSETPSLQERQELLENRVKDLEERRIIAAGSSVLAGAVKGHGELVQEGGSNFEHLMLSQEILNAARTLEIGMKEKIDEELSRGQAGAVNRLARTEGRGFEEEQVLLEADNFTVSGRDFNYLMRINEHQKNEEDEGKINKETFRLLLKLEGKEGIFKTVKDYNPEYSREKISNTISKFEVKWRDLAGKDHHLVFMIDYGDDKPVGFLEEKFRLRKIKDIKVKMAEMNIEEESQEEEPEEGIVLGSEGEQHDEQHVIWQEVESLKVSDIKEGQVVRVTMVEGDLFSHWEYIKSKEGDVSVRKLDKIESNDRRQQISNSVLLKKGDGGVVKILISNYGGGNADVTPRKEDENDIEFDIGRESIVVIALNAEETKIAKDADQALKNLQEISQRNSSGLQSFLKLIKERTGLNSVEYKDVIRVKREEGNASFVLEFVKDNGKKAQITAQFDQSNGGKLAMKRDI